MYLGGAPVCGDGGPNMDHNTNTSILFMGDAGGDHPVLPDNDNIPTGEVPGLGGPIPKNPNAIKGEQPMTLVYFYVENGVTKFGSVSLVAPAADPLLGFLALMGIGT